MATQFVSGTLTGGGAPQAAPAGHSGGGPQGPGPQGPGSNGPMMTYKVQREGQETSIDDQALMQQLAQGGYNPVKISPDGTVVTMQDAKGVFEVPARTILNKMGWEVAGIKPANAAYGQEHDALRAAITKLPDDNAKRSFLEQTLQNQGMSGARIEGSGRDWFVFSPQANQWISMTNNPEWDSTDAVEGAMEIPRAAGAIIGGALGAGSGLLSAGTTSVPGFLAGTAAGGFAGDALGRGALSLFNPEYASVAEENLGGIIQDMALGSAIDTGTAGLLKGAGPAISKFLPKTGKAVQAVTDYGVASPALRGTGMMAEGVGEGVAQGARAVNTPFGRSVGSAFVPVVGPTEMAGAVAQAPGMMARGLPNTMSKAGRSEFMQKYAPKAGDWLDNQSHRFRTVRAQQAPHQKAQQAYGIPRARDSYAPYESTSESVMGSLAAGGSKGQQKAAGMAGRGMDRAQYIGEKVQDVSQGVMGAGYKAAEMGGRAAASTGRAMNTLGTMTGPIESRIATRYTAGSEAEDYIQNQLEALQRKRMQRKIDSNSTGYN